eukprot:CAMPEP_0201651034 /NCGR_PEP_ID=MMETSP0493-20130528/42312_1 /ASSEMBLY_ACC=CAM_ASM_000838 /TAXON_ID=420259 /ORGANISM="Thalassiosira gravida, Strain GMp14c1" /LENGTH=227 /DNA_ID=CAMNT_0048127293 /DNA_START=19 /DNA_END=702 /DNA_ORIENTATION=-
MNTTVNNSILILIGIAAILDIPPFSHDGQFIHPAISAKYRDVAADDDNKNKNNKINNDNIAFNSPLFSPNDDNDDDNKNNNNENSTPSQEFDGFNPFQPGAKMPTKSGFGILSSDSQKKTSAATTTPGGQISPRQMRMKELTGNLLNCLSSDDAVAELLQSNEDFLLEQLNDVDVVLEPGSVYTPDMSREERFREYERVMEERIGDARAPAAKKALGALLDFVMDRE